MVFEKGNARYLIYDARNAITMGKVKGDKLLTLLSKIVLEVRTGSETLYFLAIASLNGE